VAFLGIGLKSSTHKYIKHNTWSTCTSIKQGSYHRPIYLLIYRLNSRVEVQVPVCTHRCIDRFCVLHPKLLENILRVLHLGDEDVVLELFYLKSKEVGQLAHHRHLEFLHHHPAKFLTRLGTSRAKYYVIDIYLEYKQVTITSFSEKELVLLSRP
jgi:hypothetical protein